MNRFHLNETKKYDLQNQGYCAVLSFGAVSYFTQGWGGSSYSIKGKFSNDEGDGSENVTIKTNSRFFLKHRRNFSNLL